MAMQHHRLQSRHLGNERSVWVYEPSATEGPWNVAVFLDAELYREGMGGAHLMERLDAAGAIAPTLAVFISHESKDARWIECPCYPPFAAFMVEELMPWLEKTYPTILPRATRALIGVSYTGLAATYVALEHPGLFDRVIAQSASFWWNDCWLVEQVRTGTTPITAQFHLDVGRTETQRNVEHKKGLVQKISQIEGVERMRDALFARGATVRFEWHEFGHEFRGWVSALPDAVLWALPKVAG